MRDRSSHARRTSDEIDRLDDFFRHLAQAVRDELHRPVKYSGCCPPDDSVDSL